MNTFSIKEALTFGWTTFKKDPWFYVGVTAALAVFSITIEVLTGQGHGFFALIGFVIGLAASTVVTIAYARLALSSHDGEHVGWDGLWAPQHFWRSLGATILQMIIIVVGLVLLIVPGLIAIVALFFTQLAVVDKALNPVAALKESYRLTKGHWLRIWLFMLCLAILNIVGLALLLVGLLVTIPVSLLAIVFVYRKMNLSQTIAVVAPAAS